MTLPPAYTYTAFDQSTHQLYPYVGDHVALLVPESYYDETTLARITTAIDKAYSFYAQATGREPNLYYQFNGRSTIAVVPDSCGGGCGFLGSTGIELETPTFDLLFRGVSDRNQFDHVVFYELGRNFWFYENKIEYVNSSTGDITTGFAVFMRFMAMEAAGVTGGPFNGTDFAVFQSEVERMLDRYLADSSLNWANTLQIGKAPANPMNLGATDLFASFLFKLRAQYGNKFVLALWQKVGQQPVRQTTQDAINNFVAAASLAAGEDLTTLFAQEWRWPVTLPPPTGTPTVTKTPTKTAPATSTATATKTPTKTASATSTATQTTLPPVATPTMTPTGTNTAMSTDLPTPTATDTPVPLPATSTATATPVPADPITPTASATTTLVVLPTATQPTLSPELTDIPSGVNHEQTLFLPLIRR